MRKLLFSLLLTLSLGIAGVSQAQTQRVEAVSWDVTIDQVDTTANRFVVNEVQNLDFTGAFTFGVRDISLSSLEAVEDITVSVDGEALSANCNSNPGTFCVTDRFIEKNVRYVFPEPITNDEVTVEISYTVIGALRVYEGGDQLQWQAIPQRHSYPVESSTVTVILPEDSAPRQGTDPIASEGAPGSFTVTGSTVTIETMRAIAANEKFSVRIQYPHDPNARMASWQPASDAEVQYEEVTKPLIQLALAALAVLLLIGGPLIAYALWSARGREVSVTVPTFISEPPSDIHPALAGLLTEGKVQTRHILATLFDLARRGFLKIEENRYAGTPSFSFIKSAAPPAGDTLSYYESRLMQDVFSVGEVRSLESMKESFYREMSSLRRMVNDELAERKYINPERISMERSYSGLARPMLLFGVGLTFFAIMNAQQERQTTISDFAINISLFGVALVVNGLMLRFLSTRISQFTQQGVEAREKTAAFKKFLADREKFRELGYTGESFEKYLPYAIAFGMDTEWIARFQNVPEVTSPVWYVPVYVDTTPYGYGGYGTPSTSPSEDGGGLGGIFTGGDDNRSSGSSGSLDSISSGIGSGLGAISAGLGSFLNTAASAMTSTPAPVVQSYSSSSSNDSSSSWSGSSGDDSGSGWSGGDSGGGWSGGGDSGGGDSGGGGSDFG